MSEPPPKQVQVDEVIPPGQPDRPLRSDPLGPTHPKELLQRSLPRYVASLLDTCITIPGTKFRIGLDPIIGFFFPGIGDAITAAMGATIIREALRQGIPRPILIRMGTNIAVNAAVGSIPFVGDAFSMWFKSNAKNYSLLIRHTIDPTHPIEKGPLWPVFVILGVAFLLIFLVFYGVYSLIRALT